MPHPHPSVYWLLWLLSLFALVAAIMLGPWLVLDVVRESRRELGLPTSPMLPRSGTRLLDKLSFALMSYFTGIMIGWLFYDLWVVQWGHSLLDTLVTAVGFWWLSARARELHWGF